MTGQKQKSAQLKLKGDCTIYEISGLSKQLSEVLKKAPVVTLDLSSIERVDVSFLQLLVSLQAEAELTQTRLSLKHPAENITALIESMHFDLAMDLPIKSSDAGGAMT